MKIICKYVLLLLFAINLNAQKSDTLKNESLKSESVELIRKVFWNKLPKPASWTNDYENLYSKNEQHKLDSIISKFEIETTIEIGIVTIDTLKTSTENFDNLSLHIAQTWGIGKKDKHNGILIAISRGHKRIKIQNGNGIEKIITDKETSEIIENYFIPEFRKGEYYNGTLKGLMELISLLKSKL